MSSNLLHKDRDVSEVRKHIKAAIRATEATLNRLKRLEARFDKENSLLAVTHEQLNEAEGRISTIKAQLYWAGQELYRKRHFIQSKQTGRSMIFEGR
jgi:chromosome segregation ATPase